MNLKISFKSILAILWFLIVGKSTLIANDTIHSKHYLLIINARGLDWKVSSKTFSLTGHAFVSWATQVGDEEAVVQKTAGFYPNHKANWVDMIFDTLQGHIEYNFDTNSNYLNVPVEQAVMEVDSSSWVASQQAGHAVKHNAYNLFHFNCVSFVDKVVAAARLQRTDTKRFWVIPVSPLNYLKRVCDLNQAKVVQVKLLWKTANELPDSGILANGMNKGAEHTVVTR
jgi:hypothetical protein